MKMTLKTYQMNLTTTGPVFVGSGKEISKKEYLFLPGGDVAVLDAAKLHELLGRKHAQQEYLRFMLASGTGAEELESWLQRQRVTLAEITGCSRYVLKNQSTVTVGEPRLQIMECIKDSYGSVYIPGSSVKGMLRTILLCADILEHPERYARAARAVNEELVSAEERWGRKPGRKQVLARTINQVEAERYRTLNRDEKKPGSAVNDILSGLIVSDSEPLDISSLALCQKIDCGPDGTEHKLPILRECIRPGVKISFSLTIDESVCPLSAERIIAAIERFDEMYEENFRNQFAGVDRVRPDTVFLGGGAGFVSKTMIYAMFPGRDGVRVTQKIFEKTGVPREHKHVDDLKNGVSPHMIKCTRYQGKLLQMGMCSCEINEISGNSLQRQCFQ